MSADGEFSHKAAERELERLKKFGARLAALKPSAVATPEDLAALQDQNLAAFEAMTEEVGLSALERMEILATEMRAAFECSDDKEAVDTMTDRMRQAAQDLDALRDRETERLLDRIARQFERNAARGEGESE